jgi:hypothetical protein
LLALSACWLAAQVSTVPLPQDKGPDKIDVSVYPENQQKVYAMFRTKCSKCHTIARPLNTSMTRAEWERYVKRMLHKPNSEINENEGRRIFGFLLFDQTERKAKNPAAFFPPLSDEEIQKLQDQQHR